MLFDLVGVLTVNYKDKNTGAPTTARVLQTVSDTTDKRYRGRCVEGVFVADSLGYTSLIDSMPVPALIDIEYGRHDSIQNIKLVEPKK